MFRNFGDKDKADFDFTLPTRDASHDRTFRFLMLCTHRW